MPIWLIQIVVGIVLSVAATLAQQAFAPKPKTSTSAASGTRDTVTTGGTNPQSFVIGTFGLPGQLEYDNAYGTSGGTPNAYRVRVISLGDLPITALTGLYEAGQAMTLSLSGHVSQGYPVAERRDGSTDCFWWEFHDGTQTTADTFLSATFGSDAARPWTSDMVGRGIPYITLTALYDRNVWNAVPNCMMQVQGIPLYDPRKDTTAGGTGSQRLNDQSTWAFTDNLAVMIYNILVGIRYQNAIIWGGRCAQTQLPYANWAAAMDACDTDIDLVAGGTEKQFRGGREILLSDKPADIINEFLIAANARISEAAGVYTILVGAPGSADFTFTDADTIVTEQTQLDPFPNLDNTVNGATGQYLEPTEAWASKDTAPYYRSDLETADRDRRQAQALTLNVVFSGTQAQRILKATVEEARRFAKHVIPLVPMFGTYRPLQLGAWTSDANGYSSKLFLVTAWTEASNGNVTFGLQEIDPTDHDWTPGTDEKALSFAPLTPVKPPAQSMTGWTVSPYVYPDSASTNRRIGIAVTFTGALFDVRAVRIQVKEDFGAGNTVFDGEQAYDPSESDPVSRAITWAGIIPNTDYQVRGKFQPFSGRETDWSSWLSVTTANVAPVSTQDIIDASKSVLEQLGQVRSLIEQFKQIGTLIEAVDRDNYTQRQTLSRSISVQMDNLEASFNEIIEVALGPGGAIATALESLYAAMGGNTAEVNVQWAAVAAPTGYSARYAIQAAVNDGSFRSATLFLDVPADAGQPTRIGFEAGQTVFFTSDGTPLAVIGDDGVFRSANDTIQVDLINGTLLAQSAGADGSYISVNNGVDIYSLST
jgi:hypothetical protein